MLYKNTLASIENPLPILADFPEYVEPLVYEHRYLAPPVVNEQEGGLLVRSWRYWYNARGIIEMENRLEAKAVAIIVVHPWGVDDGAGLRTPDPAGVAFFCTREKNQIVQPHLKQVVNPFLSRLRERVGVIGYSMPLREDDIRKQLYASARTRTEELNPEDGRARLAALLKSLDFSGKRLVEEIELDPDRLVRSYIRQTPSVDALSGYNNSGFWDLPVPLHAALEHRPEDIVFYDDEGYPTARDFLKSRGIRHVLLMGYCTDECVRCTTCGYDNLSNDFNVFIVGDATLARFPACSTPRFATQAALANASLNQMITQVNWIHIQNQK